jgi:hypothetical protein
MTLTELSTTPSMIQWNDIRRHLIKNGVKVAPMACCPGCGDNSKSNIDFDKDTHVFIREGSARAFNGRNDWRMNRRDARNDFWLTWGGEGSKIVDILRELPLFVEWNGTKEQTIHCTVKETR